MPGRPLWVELIGWCGAVVLPLTLGRQVYTQWRDGHGSYRDVENPIVRIRYNTRTAPDGKKVMFIEEMQGPSDAEQEKMPKFIRERIYDIGLKRAMKIAADGGFDTSLRDTRRSGPCA